MAHHRRKRSRIKAGKRYSSNGRERRMRGRCPEWAWLTNWPRWWDIEFHTRPRRRRIRAMEQKVMKGDDPDNMAWPLDKKPHQYYW